MSILREISVSFLECAYNLSRKGCYVHYAADSTG